MSKAHNETDTNGETGRLEVEQHETAGGLLLRDETDVEKLIDALKEASPFFSVATEEGLGVLRDRVKKGETLSEDGSQSNDSIIAGYTKKVAEDALAKEKYFRPRTYGHVGRLIGELKESGMCEIAETLPYSPGLEIRITGDGMHPFIAELRFPSGYDTHRVYEAEVAKELGLERGLSSIDIEARVFESNAYDIATLLNRLAYSSLTPVVQAQGGCLGPLGKIIRGDAGKYKTEDVASSLVNNAKFTSSPDPIYLGVRYGCVASLKLAGGRGAGVDGTTIKFADKEGDAGFVITISGYEILGKDSWNTAFLSTPQQVESARRLADEISSALQQ